MKRLFVSLIIITSLLSCKSDDGGTVNNNNPFLTPPIVNITLNLNLPEYNPLRFPGNSVLINNRGIKGIVVYNLNNDLYTAFDLSDPNHLPNSCSRMDIEGIIATCPCENENGTNSYDIVTGQHQNDTEAHPMQQYRVERTGNVVTISN
ncbi:MAG: hypothetical protein JKY22_03310 [Flavobacteriaceae bacterium]|nr:hypothetical protein [Flavobacteriaceae bacterium]